ncbi:MAG: ABC transporter ATP-binding protein [Jatrophihabitans sp.]
MSAIDGLCMEDVTVRAGPLTIVEHLTLETPSGTILAVTGPPASGKSTLLATIAGARRPKTGQVLLAGRPVTRAAVRSTIGYAPQDARVLDALTAVENAALPMLTQRRPAAESWQRAAEQLDRLGIAAAAHHNLAEQLSGGQRQRVAVARATVINPPLAILDDPTSELDPGTAQLVVAVARQLAGGGSVVIIATTDDTIAATADLVLVLEDPRSRLERKPAGKHRTI